MLGFSPFKKHANQFNYKPRYYDPEVEALRERRAERGEQPSERKGENVYVAGEYIRRRREERNEYRRQEAADRKKRGMIRMLIMIVVVVAGLVMREWLHPCGVIVGVFAIKVSAYLQPFFIHQSEKNA